jgi:endo-1,4-beta-mannosidase
VQFNHHLAKLALTGTASLLVALFTARAPGAAFESRGGASSAAVRQPVSSAAVQSSESVDLPFCSLDGSYFSHGGKRFFPVGAHWVPAKAGLQWPLSWNPQEIETDFAKMRDLGFNALRLDLFWAWFEPRPGDYNPEAFKQLDYLVSLAHRYKIYLHPTLFIGGEVGEAFWDVPWRYGRHPQADPEMLRLQTNHAAELARRYRDESAILAWDLTDEPPYWIVAASTTDAMAINWTRLISAALRRYDGRHLIVVGTSMEDVGHGPFRPDIIRDEVDFFSVHPYTIYSQDLFPDPMVSERGTYGAAFQIALSSSAGRPAMIQELGASSAQYAPERIAIFDRLSMYSGLGAGANGFLLWCFTDAAPEQFNRVPYLRAPHETQFGLTTWQREDRPRAAGFRQFARILDQLDLSGIEPSPAEAGIVVPDEWAKPHGDFSRLGLEGPSIIPYVSTQDGGAVSGQTLPDTSEQNSKLTGAWLSSFILSRRAGFKADFPREYTAWQSRPMILLPSPLTGTENNLVHVHTDFWEKARRYVANGGALYASVSADAAIPGMAELFGARLVDHASVTDVTLRMVASFGDLKPGDMLRYTPPSGGSQYWAALIELRGGKVIAVDQAGRPALVTNTVGAGKTLLCAYPLECYLAGKPSAFETGEDTYRIYRAFRDWAGIRPQFQTDQPSVEVMSLKGTNRGFAVVVNHSPEARQTRITTSLPLKTARRIASGISQPLDLQGQGWIMELQPYDGVIVEWEE